MLGAGTLVACMQGCAPYQVGNASLYAPDVRTIYVPMFESDSFRRQLGERLTEAVVKEIELKSNMKVVSSPNADSILTGKIISDTKRVLNETRTDEVRDLDVTLRVQVSWTDRQGNDLRQPQSIPMPVSTADVLQSRNVVPEYGESIATGQQEAIQKLAEQIVSLLEAPW